MNSLPKQSIKLFQRNVFRIMCYLEWMSQLMYLSTSISVHGPDVTVVLLLKSFVKCQSTHKATPLHDPDLQKRFLIDSFYYWRIELMVTLQFYVPL